MNREAYEGRFVLPRAGGKGPGFLHFYRGRWTVCPGWKYSHSEDLPAWVQFHPEHGILWQEGDGDDKPLFRLGTASPEHYIEELDATVLFAWGDDPSRPCYYECPAHWDERDEDGDAVSLCLLAPKVPWISPGEHNCIIQPEVAAVLLGKQPREAKEAQVASEKARLWWLRRQEILEMLQERCGEDTCRARCPHCGEQALEGTAQITLRDLPLYTWGWGYNESEKADVAVLCSIRCRACGQSVDIESYKGQLPAT